MAGEDVAAVGVDLDKPASDHAGTLQAEVNATDAAEQAADRERPIHNVPPPRV